MTTYYRNNGSFWQSCTRCGIRAEANKTVRGTPVLHRQCADEVGAVWLPTATPDERHEWRQTGEWPPVDVPE
jgi:hypothetical protein